MVGNSLSAALLGFLKREQKSHLSNDRADGAPRIAFNRRNALKGLIASGDYAKFEGSAVCYDGAFIAGFAFDTAPRTSGGFRIRPFVCCFWEEDFFISLSLSSHLVTSAQTDRDVWMPGQNLWSELRSQALKAERDFIADRLKPTRIVRHFESGKDHLFKDSTLLSYAWIEKGDAMLALSEIAEVERLCEKAFTLGPSSGHLRGMFDYAQTLRGVIERDGCATASKFIRERTQAFAEMHGIPPFRQT